VIVRDQDQAEHLEGDLRRIGVGAQVTLVDREAHRALDDGEAAALTGGYRIPDRPGAVVVLVRRREQNAAAGQA